MVHLRPATCTRPKDRLLDFKVLQSPNLSGPLYKYNINGTVHNFSTRDTHHLTASAYLLHQAPSPQSQVAAAVGFLVAVTALGKVGSAPREEGDTGDPQDEGR